MQQHAGGESERFEAWPGQGVLHFEPEFGGHAAEHYRPSPAIARLHYLQSLQGKRLQYQYSRKAAQALDSCLYRIAQKQQALYSS